MGCIVLLAACAASESQLVQEGNWYQIGYQDAVTGHTQRSYKSLMELGSAKLGDYEQGYQKGLEQYCNPDVAYQIGLSGNIMKGFVKVQSRRSVFVWSGNAVGMSTINNR